MQVVMGFDVCWFWDECDRMLRALWYHELSMSSGMIVQTAVKYQTRYIGAEDSMESMSWDRDADEEERFFRIALEGCWI